MYRISLDPKERQIYEDMIQAEFNRRTSEQNFYDAGVEDGIKKGVEEGLKKKQIETVKAMLKKQLPIELIIEITELTKEEIEKLK